MPLPLVSQIFKMTLKCQLFTFPKGLLHFIQWHKLKSLPWMALYPFFLHHGGRGVAVGPTPLVSINHAETSGNHLSALRHTNRMIYRPGLCVFLNLILIYLK